MKKLVNNSKNTKSHKIINLVDNLIDHRAFLPIAISILVAFVMFKSYQYSTLLFRNYKSKEIRKNLNTPIKVTIVDDSINFDINNDQLLEHKIKQGDNLMKILSSVGANENDINLILDSLKKNKINQYLVAGNSIAVSYKVKLDYKIGDSSKTSNKAIIINNIRISVNSDREIIIDRIGNENYNATEVKVKLTRYISRYSGTIKNGLFIDGVNSGISPNSMMNMINLYAYDIDFQRDIKSGDKFEMLVESFFDETGKKIKDGNVLFSSLTLKDKTVETYLHKVGDRFEYFDSQGNSVRKSLLRTPVNGARISSGFGMRRHPILGYSKMHKGADFAAPTGTPILAAGAGSITYMGVKGGYGNYVQIKHNNDYSTAYGHASRFNKKFRNGSKVKQGDIIAYVGSTGRSTGPHLHFEVIYKGSQINPAKVKATSGIRLSGKDLIKFKLSKSEIDGYRKNIPNLFKIN